jgi:glutathione reductase (NADPH)
MRFLVGRTREVRKEQGALAVHVAGAEGDQVLPADYVLNATGRVAAVEELDLARAGVEANERGVVVDDFLRSPGNRRVFAGGDAHGVLQLSPVASYEGRVIARNLLMGDVQRADYSVIPRILFTTPPLAAVGLTEQAAKGRGLDIEVASHDMKGWKVFAIAGEEAARAKVVTERGSGRLLGAHLWATAAPDLIHFLGMAIRHGATRDDLEDMVYAYPTAGSALAYAMR